MKKVLHFIFNIIRNTSLIILIGLIVMLVYFEKNGTITNNLAASFGNLKASQKNQLSNSESTFETQRFEMQGVEEQPLSSSESKKIKLEVKGGFAYLRASQIMYVTSRGSLVLVNEKKIMPTQNITEIEERLKTDNRELFFRIKSAIINCNYVHQLVRINNSPSGSYNYQDKIIMEDGKEINISKPKANELAEILDKLML